MARRPFISRRAAGGAVHGVGGAERITGARYGGLAVLTPFDPYFQAATYVYAGNVDRLGAQFRSWKEPLMKSLIEVVMPSIKANFRAGGRPKWQPLSRVTIKERLRKGFPRGPILVRTGNLRKVATSRQIWVVEPQFRGPGSDALILLQMYLNQRVPYARYNQIGTAKELDSNKKWSTFLEATISRGGGVFPPEGFEARQEYNPFLAKWHTPARPFIMIQTEDEIEIYGIFSEYLYQKANKYWGMMPDYRGH